MRFTVWASRSGAFLRRRSGQISSPCATPRRRKRTASCQLAVQPILRAVSHAAGGATAHGNVIARSGSDPIHPRRQDTATKQSRAWLGLLRRRCGPSQRPSWSGRIQPGRHRELNTTYGGARRRTLNHTPPRRSFPLDKIRFFAYGVGRIRKQGCFSTIRAAGIWDSRRPDYVRRYESTHRLL